MYINCPLVYIGLYRTAIDTFYASCQSWEIFLNSRSSHGSLIWRKNVIFYTFFKKQPKHFCKNMKITHYSSRRWQQLALHSKQARSWNRLNVCHTPRMHGINTHTCTQNLLQRTICVLIEDVVALLVEKKKNLTLQGGKKQMLPHICLDWIMFGV